VLYFVLSDLNGNAQQFRWPSVADFFLLNMFLKRPDQAEEEPRARSYHPRVCHAVQMFQALSCRSNDFRDAMRQLSVPCFVLADGANHASAMRVVHDKIADLRHPQRGASTTSLIMDGLKELDMQLISMAPAHPDNALQAFSHAVQVQLGSLDDKRRSSVNKKSACYKAAMLRDATNIPMLKASLIQLVRSKGKDVLLMPPIRDAGWDQSALDKLATDAPLPLELEAVALQLLADDCTIGLRVVDANGKGTFFPTDAVVFITVVLRHSGHWDSAAPQTEPTDEEEPGGEEDEDAEEDSAPGADVEEDSAPGADGEGTEEPSPSEEESSQALPTPSEDAITRLHEVRISTGKSLGLRSQPVSKRPPPAAADTPSAKRQRIAPAVERQPRRGKSSRVKDPDYSPPQRSKRARNR